MSPPLLTFTQYAAQVSLTSVQQSSVVGVLTPSRTASDWAGVIAQILASPITHWEVSVPTLDPSIPVIMLSGPNAVRQAFATSTLLQKAQWNVTDGLFPTYWFTPGDTSWRDSQGNNPDVVVVLDNGGY